MVHNMPNIIYPYLNHPLVENANPYDLAFLDEKELNDVIRSVDLIFRGLKDYSHNPEIGVKRLHAGHFGSSVQIARAWSFLDFAHSIQNVETIIDKVYPVTSTSSKAVYLKNMRDSVLPRLMKNGLIQIDASSNKITDVMPYPISSKLYVKKELLENPTLFSQQINQFTILNNVQYFPELRNELQATATNPSFFPRDYNALEEIDIIRTRQIKGREFTLSKSYLTGNDSVDIWKTVLDTSDHVRKGLKDLLEIQGDLGGFVSQSELSIMAAINPRIANQLIRRIDSIGIAQRTQTLELEDALSRPISGTRLNSNYKQLNNAQSLLILIRSVPEAIELIHKLHKDGKIDEDELINEFDPMSVGKVRNALENIGVIHQVPSIEDECIYEIVPNKECDEFLSDVLTVSAHSRRLLGEEIDINKKLEESFRKCDDETLKKQTKQITLDFMKIVDEENRS